MHVSKTARTEDGAQRPLTSEVALHQIEKERTWALTHQALCTKGTIVIIIIITMEIDIYMYMDAHYNPDTIANRVSVLHPNNSTNYNTECESYLINPKVIIRFLGIRSIGGAPTFQIGTLASISMLA